ncbi:hypothetical protein VNO78_27047 [Psophocarpus tetragonolobus]|uniref:Uncharacterized protein n=1 Tax=Psophocarpus tetragonolobus TaxID=3891 RepID=A0AAN9X9X9_PSOTE
MQQTMHRYDLWPLLQQVVGKSGRRHRLHSPRRHGRNCDLARRKTPPPPNRWQPLRGDQGLRRRHHSRQGI